MDQEYELIACEKIKHIKVFINEISYRNYHLHSAFELLLVLRGTGSVNLAESHIPVAPGALVLLNPYEAHEIDGQGGHLTALIFQVSRHFCREYLPELGSLRFLSHDLRAALAEPDRRQIEALLCQGATRYILEEDFFAYQCLRDTAELFHLLLEGVRHDHLSDHSRSAIRKRVQRMTRILSYMEENYASPLRLRDIGEAEGLSPTYVSHFFSEQFGVTFQEYLNNLRFERALDQLSSGAVSVSEAALSSGFSDPKYLNQMMRRRMGCSAAEYRRGLGSPAAAPRAPEGQLERVLSPEEALEVLADYSKE